LRGQALNVAGPAAKVAEFARGREIIRQEAFGGLVSATLLGKLTPFEQKQAQALGLELAPVSLQELIVRLTTENTDRKAA
jgi:ABC-2 type transport system ATP-binding protein